MTMSDEFPFLFFGRQPVADFAPDSPRCPFEIRFATLSDAATKDSIAAVFEAALKSSRDVVLPEDDWPWRWISVSALLVRINAVHPIAEVFFDGTKSTRSSKERVCEREPVLNARPAAFLLGSAFLSI